MRKVKEAAHVKVPGSNTKFGDLARAVLTSKAAPKKEVNRSAKPKK
jgi:hypothetical protein